MLFFSSTPRLSDHEASPSVKSNEGSRNIDVTFFELSTVVAATEDFSANNKLGQGGFGPVYKVLLFTFENCFHFSNSL